MPFKVLIVDDSAVIRRLLRGVFLPDRFQVVAEAGNGKEAVERYLAAKPDLVIMDIVLPEVSGIDATREIVSHDPRARIIVCSALGQEDLVMQALNAGASDYIVKPFEPEDVLRVANKVLDTSP
jgi:two-component system, chemotaxis family, chemotaxis protein CheY